MTHYFEDMYVGFRFSTGPVSLSRDQIIAFAREYDAQPFHLDEAAAKASHFGDLVASGWQTLLIGFNLSLNSGIWAEASMGASGMDDVRWLKPVYPGDALHLEAEVIAAERSRSRPDRGRVRLLHRIVNQRGDTVASYVGNHLMKARLPD